jgi:hypothetical protein
VSFPAQFKCFDSCRAEPVFQTLEPQFHTKRPRFPQVTFAVLPNLGLQCDDLLQSLTNGSKKGAVCGNSLLGESDVLGREQSGRLYIE